MRLEILAIAGHGAMILIHALAALWHRLTARKWDWWACGHVVATGISTIALCIHGKRVVDRYNAYDDAD